MLFDVSVQRKKKKKKKLLRFEVIVALRADRDAADYQQRRTFSLTGHLVFWRENAININLPRFYMNNTRSAWEVALSRVGLIYN